MSLRYKGGVISATPPTTSTTSASGNWTLEQQMQAQGAGNWPFGGPFNYIEDVFSTYLYTGNATARSITNNINLSTNGGLVWIKERSAALDHNLFDTNRGAGYALYSNLTNGQSAFKANTLTSFDTTGFSLGTDAGGDGVNRNGQTYASWTFRKQPKFFDVVTFYQNGGVTVNHNLGSVPACIIIKSTSAADNWYVYHTSLNAPNGNGPRYNYLTLNSTANALNAGGIWINNITSTSFDITNQVVPPFATYVAYIFASNAGGFGLTGTDNVISCGSYTGTGASLSVSLGYEPQWILLKDTSAAGNWRIFDNMRGWPAPSGQSAYALFPNLSNAETDNGDLVYPTATGFQLSTNGTYNTSGRTYIYIAIRRGPMKTPTSGTSVFTPIARTGTGAAATVSGVGFPPDLVMPIGRNTAGYGDNPIDRLRGNSVFLKTYSTSAEVTDTAALTAWTMDGFTVGASGTTNDSGVTYVYENFRRAPGFFDVVCYTGTGAARTINHNLGVVPELMIVKTRSTGGTNRGWWTYVAPLGNAQALYLNTTDNAQGAAIWNSTTPTSTVFSVDGSYLVNESGTTYVWYGFASVAGVSKVGAFTGNGSTQTINCGFTSGARFVLIKRTDAAGDWYVYDTARGMTTLTDPYLLMNSTAAEAATLGSVTTVSTGFALNASILAAINTNGASYIFLAVS